MALLGPVGAMTSSTVSSLLMTPSKIKGELLLGIVEVILDD